MTEAGGSPVLTPALVTACNGSHRALTAQVDLDSQDSWSGHPAVTINPPGVTSLSCSAKFKIDGPVGGTMTRKIGGPGGGSEKGGKGLGFLLAVGLAVAVGAGGAGVGSSVTSGASVSSNRDGRSASRPNERDSNAAQVRLTARGIRVTARLTDDSNNCVAHAYGQVQRFFREHPCVSLHRAQLEVRDPKGDVALVPVAWVEMSSESEARDLKALMDSGGTGNVTELSRERGKYRTVRYTGDAYRSRRDGTVVVNAQAQPVVRGWSGLALTSIATNAVG